LGLPYELKFVSGDVSGSLRALAKAHVMRMAPILEDGPVKMVESGAILEYILVRYGEGRLRPPLKFSGLMERVLASDRSDRLPR